MRFTVNKSVFVDALKAVSTSVSNQEIQALKCVKLQSKGENELVLTTTNIDITISKTIQCNIAEPGGCCVEHKHILAFASAMITDSISFKSYEGDSQRSVLSGGDATFKLTTLAIEDFPKQAEVKWENKFSVTASTISTMLRRVMYARSMEDTRRMLKGVNFRFANQAIATATDGRRLAMVELAIENGENEGNKDEIKFTIPEIGAKAISRLISGDGEVSIAANNSAAMFSMSDMTIQTKLIDDGYPNVKQVIPEKFEYSISIDRQLFADAIKIGSLAIEKDGWMSIILTEGVMTFSGNNDTVSGKYFIPVKYHPVSSDDKEVSIAMNPKYILDVLDSLDADEVKFSFNNASSPIGIGSVEDKEEFIGIIMPFRV